LARCKLYHGDSHQFPLLGHTDNEFATA
jgi:hypothetical protein